MPPLSVLSGMHTIELFGHSLVVGPAGLMAVAGWLLFASGALLAVRERTHGAAIPSAPPMVMAAIALAAMSGGLGLLLSESYPSFARNFCLPYAVLALAATIVALAVHSASRRTGEE